MEYRGKTYTVVQGVGSDCWKWTVQLGEGKAKSGDARTRASAVTNAIWAINKALASRSGKPKPSVE